MHALVLPVAVQMIAQIALSIGGAAVLLHLPPDVIRLAIHRGELPALQMGGRIRVTRVDLDRWADGCRLFSASTFPASQTSSLVDVLAS